MIKILANDGIHADGKKLLEEAGFVVDTNKIAQEDLAAQLNEYSAIIVRSATKVRKDLIDACPNLKIIARAGVGLDNIDVDYAKEKGLAVINTPAASSESVAELAFAHIFTLARSLQHSNVHLPQLEEGVFKSLKKQYSSGFQLRGKTIGIVGFGRIGQETARIALGLGMNVLAADLQQREVAVELNLYNTDNIGLTVKLETTTLAEVLAKSDIVSLHVPSSSGYLIDEKEIAEMKNGAILINAARGGLINEAALLTALNTGKLRAAGLDVFENEPMPKVELLQHPNVSVSPHIGGSTVEAQSNIGTELATKIIAYYTNLTTK